MSRGALLRVTRLQFLPVILSPVIVGASLAWWTSRTFNPFVLALVIAGSISLHLAANAIDDAYDYLTGVDVASDAMFSPDFGGWKPLPRKMVSLGTVKGLAYVFFAIALAVGLYLTYLAGPLVLVLGSIGAFFGYFHVAPPLRLGYRGLGEAGVAISFGLLPSIGSFLVQTHSVSYNSILVGVPLGLLTATVLMNHDQIFFDPYRMASKRTLAVILGRKKAMNAALALTISAYLTVLLAIPTGVLPLSSATVLVSIPIFARQIQLYKTPAQSPLHYVKLTMTTFTLSVTFGLLLALSFIIG